MGLEEKRAKAWQLIEQGVLPKSEKRHCKGVGITEKEYIKQLLERKEDIKIKKDNNRESKQKRSTVRTKNLPALIVGAGPSTKEYLQGIGAFGGLIITTETMFNTLIEHNIIPDYVVTIEKWVDPPVFFKSEYLELCKGKTIFVGSSQVRGVLSNYIRESGNQFITWIDALEPRVSNVGLFGIRYAREELKCDKVFLIGFEHQSPNYPAEIIDEWIADFWYFVETYPKETIVNCSNGGVLYQDDYIIDADLNNLEILNGLAT